MNNFNFHPLTIEIKDFFSKGSNNEFIEKLRKIIEIEKVEVFPDESDDEEVIIVFPPESDLSCLVFTDGYAFVEYLMNKSFFRILFYYDTKETTKLTGVFKNRLTSLYSGYRQKGKEKLFEDILLLVESFASHKAFAEFMFKKVQEKIDDKDFDKSRIYLYPNVTIAYGKKWKEKYANSEKLTTARL